MISKMLEYDKELFCKLLDYHRTERFNGIKIEKDGDIAAMVGFDDWTANSVQIHIWSAFPGAITRKFISECLVYAYITNGRGIVIGVTACNNVAALELNRRIGFRRVHTIKDGYALGTDLAIQEMRREECRWLRKREVLGGRKEFNTSYS